MVIDRPPQIGHHALAQPGDQRHAGIRGRRQHHSTDDDGDQGMVEQPGIAAPEALVDQDADTAPERQHHGRRDEGGSDRAGDAPAIGPHERPQAAQLRQIAALRALPADRYMRLCFRGRHRGWVTLC
jgi:hypothetical protein